MRFTQIALVPAFLLGLTQGLALPETRQVHHAILGLTRDLQRYSTAVEAPGAATELSTIVARAFSCPAKAKSQCTTCPKPPKTAKTAKKGKCPKGKKGKKCKRSEEALEDAEVEEEQQNNIIEARVEIGMDSIGSGKWASGDLLETPGLSACTVMAVYDKTNWAMAHIPPARGTNQGLAKTGMEVINEYKEKMTTRSGVASMKEPRGYLLTSTLLGDEERDALRAWFRANGVSLTEKTYSPGNAGSGNFAISRETKSWPPLVSFA